MHSSFIDITSRLSSAWRHVLDGKWVRKASIGRRWIGVEAVQIKEACGEFTNLARLIRVRLEVNAAIIWND